MEDFAYILLEILRPEFCYYTILEDNMRNDVKDFWQEWPCIARHMLRNTKT